MGPRLEHHYLITARIRRMTGGYVFTRIWLLAGERGYLPWMGGGYLPWTGVPTLDEGHLSWTKGYLPWRDNLIWMGEGYLPWTGEVPTLDRGRGTYLGQRVYLPG